MKHYPYHYHDLSNGERIAYRTAGSTGPYLLLIHGNLSSSTHFQHLMKALEQECQLIAVDMRGFGRSSYHKSLHALQDLAEDLLELMDALSISAYSILGWSTGGGVALEMAASRPTAIQRLFLLSSVGVQGYLPPSKSRLVSFNILPILANTNPALAKWNPVLQRIEYALKSGQESLMRKILSPLYQNTPISDEDFRLYMEAACQQRNYSDICLLLFTFNMTNRHNGFVAGNNRIQQVTCPVHILHGTSDDVVSLESAYLTAHYLSQATLQFFDAGHSILTDQPQALLASIRQALFDNSGRQITFKL
ncbi:alpha/beta hydrolase [Streptococcus suis]|uniref:Alpha/beta hydrolase n=1 Tax=Streptococcus suivaginalis TaxID=3028082 RepID=A0AA96VK96_9STRE|nr:alpha/beta hydrolase [Streptococcus sp. 29896]MCK4028031.1 alpha/beta hydrolase [Streptococcus suis]WNY46484.1 alpha/beta hydrolase [Streptococcus sp. 29896]